jgi:uncharacterized protein YjlB
MSSHLTPLSTLRISKHFIHAHAGFPNTSLNPYPLLIYHRCFDPPTSTANIQSHLRSVGVVEPAWVYPMYKQHHYHSTTHEVLVVANGSARLFFGGEGNPKGIRQVVAKGDVMILPAGTGHAMEEDLGGFSMVGSYPTGADNWDHCTGNEGKEAEDRIRALKWFKQDPIYGQEGPVLDIEE